MPNRAPCLWRGDPSGTDESRSCSSFPTGHLREQRSPWTTEPGQTTAAGRVQSIPVAGLCRQCHENFRRPADADTDHQRANVRRRTLHSNDQYAGWSPAHHAMGQPPQAHVWQRHPAQNQTPAPPGLHLCFSVCPPRSLVSAKGGRENFLSGADQSGRDAQKVWAGAFRNRKEVVTAVIFCGRFFCAIATYHYTSFILFHLADADSFALFLTEHKPTWPRFKWFQTLPMAIKKITEKFSQLR